MSGEHSGHSRPGGATGRWQPAIGPAARRKLCTDCGLSRTATPQRCGRACQFLRPDYPTLEARTHGRCRDPERGDELHFGVYRSMYRAALRTPAAGAQWTGITTRLAERSLASGRVDAVLTTQGAADDRWRPEPVIVDDASELAACRGMRMGYAPLLALLEPALRAGYTRLGVIALPCQVYPLRALEQELGLEHLDIIGTPCADNTTTEQFHRFLALLTDRPEQVSYLEFRPDYHVELRLDDGSLREIPFLQLPISRLPKDFWPLTCRACVDYTNALADITVGYMAGRGRQWVLVRNERGGELLELLGDEVELEAPTSAGRRHKPVQGFIDNTERAADGLPTRGMPNWLRPLFARLMPRIGPRGLELARARLEMKAAEALIQLRAQAPRRLPTMIPDHIRALVRPYRVPSLDSAETSPEDASGPRGGDRS